MTEESTQLYLTKKKQSFFFQSANLEKKIQYAIFLCFFYLFFLVFLLISGFPGFFLAIF